ncbi:MAG: hemin uptake protein HemP [Thioalkalivibrio sp.]|nr:hemin uptake protein HemP [Thioalkalivibrio sp.]
MWENNQPKSESPGTNIPGASTESQRINSATLFSAGDVVLIHHQGTVYTLRKTRNGKLILTK